MEKASQTLPKRSRPACAEDKPFKKTTRSDSDHLYASVGPAGLNDTSKYSCNTPNFRSFYKQRESNKPHPNTRFTAFSQFLNYRYKSKPNDKPESATKAKPKPSPLNTTSQSLYDVLEIEANCLDTDIRKAYRKLASKHHPDKGGTAEDFQRIKEAYEILSKPE